MTENDIILCVCGRKAIIKELKKVNAEKLPKPEGGMFQPRHFYCECDPHRARVYDKGEGDLVISDPELARVVAELVVS